MTRRETPGPQPPVAILAVLPTGAARSALDHLAASDLRHEVQGQVVVDGDIEMARVVVTETMAAGVAGGRCPPPSAHRLPLSPPAIDDSAACYTEALPDERG